eukprot:m.32976 g.32976  ORF g.32976 m.32976 type:complete len:279 (+) comp31738_c0_seq1:83-919(+)
MSSRPEHRGPPELFYNDQEARKYTCNSRMIEIQMQMASRAIELLNLPEGQPSFILDVGCGSGLSGEALTEEGHFWVGIDISSSMLNVAVEREIEGDLFLSDMGNGVFFRPGTFDGVISVSALQWLCNADKKSHNPAKRLNRFFSTLFASMVRGGRAVFQFYPENPAQMELITSQALRAGFSGGIVIDYPNSTKAKKFFLCLFCGEAGPMPKGLGTEEETRNTVRYTDAERRQTRKGKQRVAMKSRQWILEKKERRRRQGRGETRPDTKYTARKRRPIF